MVLVLADDAEAGAYHQRFDVLALARRAILPDGAADCRQRITRERELARQQKATGNASEGTRLIVALYTESYPVRGQDDETRGEECVIPPTGTGRQAGFGL